MSADNRTVTTDALETLGSIITEREARDAIHIAVEPAVAVSMLVPGQHVGFVDNGVGPCASPVGIVDPFLTGSVMPGERFWLLVYPRQITSLRHVWSHPAFPEPGLGSKTQELVESVAWLEQYARGLGVSYPELMRHAADYLQTGDTWSEGSSFAGEYADDEFWDHYEQATEQDIKTGNRGNFFVVDCCC